MFNVLEETMTHFTRYGRRMKSTALKTATFVCLACFATLPFFTKNILKNDVGYYSITVNGVEVGAANSEEQANEAIAEARLELSKQYDSLVYMNPEIEITKEDRLVANRLSTEELKDAIYSNLFNSVIDIEKQMAYTIRIDDYTVTLGSKDDVVSLIEKITAKYDENHEFQVTLETADAASGRYHINIAKSQIRNTDVDIVAAALNGESVVTTEGGSSSSDGITGIGFAESVVVSETSAANSTIKTVDQAYEEITKEKAEKTVYIVEQGDCLSAIANRNGLKLSELIALNEGLTENSIIAPGDSIVITVPTAEITVVTKKTMTYEEDYNADITYVDDDTNYRGTNTVISEGTTGHRKVTAEVTYSNGKETERTYIAQDIMVESVPQVIAVGTLTPPTYIRPINSGRYSSGYGYRDGSFHAGVDWSCSQGTPVMAAASGTVIRAGWYSGYGYCVDIRHSNGTMTRYGHLSSISVSNGQSVSQGQVIAKSGNTGQSSGPHLHFEIWINGSTVNPLNYVNKN